jgi:hypothetical protein
MIYNDQESSPQYAYYETVSQKTQDGISFGTATVLNVILGINVRPSR